MKSAWTSPRTGPRVSPSTWAGLPVDYYMVAVCSDADQKCPTVWPGLVARLVWPFDDPAAMQDSEEQRLAAFRRIRDEIEERICAWLAEVKDPAREALSQHR